MPLLDILFSSNHNIHKSSSDHCFCASDPLIDIFLRNLSIKGSEDQKKNGQTNFYECCDLTKKVYLAIMLWMLGWKISYVRNILRNGLYHEKWGGWGDKCAYSLQSTYFMFFGKSQDLHKYIVLPILWLVLV